MSHRAALVVWTTDVPKKIRTAVSSWSVRQILDSLRVVTFWLESSTVTAPMEAECLTLFAGVSLQRFSGTGVRTLALALPCNTAL